MGVNHCGFDVLLLLAFGVILLFFQGVWRLRIIFCSDSEHLRILRRLLIHAGWCCLACEGVMLCTLLYFCFVVRLLTRN